MNPKVLAPGGRSAEIGTFWRPQSFIPSRWLSQMVAIDQTPELFSHSVYQLLLVPLVLPELGKDVVLAAGVFHPVRRGKNKSGHFQHKPFAGDPTSKNHRATSLLSRIVQLKE